VSPISFGLHANPAPEVGVAQCRPLALAMTGSSGRRGCWPAPPS